MINQVLSDDALAKLAALSQKRTLVGDEVDRLMRAIPALIDTVKALKAQLEQLKRPRLFPIQSGAPAVRWELAQKAYTTYADLFGTSQSLERLAERGGFGLEEFSCLYLGHDPRCKHSGKCVAEVESQIGYVDLQSQLEALKEENERLKSEAARRDA